MTDASSAEQQRTLAIAGAALQRIKALRLPASPRNFEIWFAYACAHNPSLNETINDILNRNGTISRAELDQIYDSHISASRFADKTDQLGSRIHGQIEQIIGIIAAAAGDASNFSESLGDFAQALARATDIGGVRSIVEGLVQATSRMKENNKALETRLSASRDEISQLHHQLEAVRKESVTDPLTSLGNRKYFDDALSRQIAIAAERRHPVSLLMADIDHFKAFNDRHGHLTGDQVLRLVALAIKQSIKDKDTAARYGGEEFAVVLPDTALQRAASIAERLREAVMSKELIKRSTRETLGRVTISIGLATLHPGDSPQSLIGRADNCLYAAKRRGRNRVVSEIDPEPAMDSTVKVA
jgi:diguanylate cyclase